MYFRVFSEDDAFVLCSAELKINYTRCVLTACFIRAAMKHGSCATLKGTRWGFSQRRTKPHKSRNLLQHDSTDVARKVIQLIQTVKFSKTFSGPRKSLERSHKMIWKHSYKDGTWETMWCILRKCTWLPFQGVLWGFSCVTDIKL